MAKSVVVLGKGDLAIKVAQWFHRSPDYDLVAIVPTVPEPAWSASFMEWARGAAVPVIESGRYMDLVKIGWKVRGPWRLGILRPYFQG